MIDWIGEAVEWIELGGSVLVVFDTPERRALYQAGLPDGCLVLATQNPFNLPDLPEGTACLCIGVGELDLGMLEALCELGSRPECRLLRARPTTAHFQMALAEVGRMLGFPSGVLVKTVRQLGATNVEIEFDGLPVSGPVKVTVSGHVGEVTEVEEVREDGKPGRAWKRETPGKPAGGPPAAKVEPGPAAGKPAKP